MTHREYKINKIFYINYYLTSSLSSSSCVCTQLLVSSDNFYKDDVEVEASVCWDWFRKATLDAFSLAVLPLEINVPGYGDKLGVEQWLLLKSHWSNNRSNSSAVGPPFGIGSATYKNNPSKKCR